MTSPRYRYSASSLTASASANAHVKDVNVFSPTRLAMGHGPRYMPETVGGGGGRAGGGCSVLVRSVLLFP